MKRFRAGESFGTTRYPVPDFCFIVEQLTDLGDEINVTGRCSLCQIYMRGDVFVQHVVTDHIEKRSS